MGITSCSDLLSCPLRRRVGQGSLNSAFARSRPVPTPPLVPPTGNDLSGYRNRPMPDSCARAMRAHPQIEARPVENGWDPAWNRLDGLGARGVTVGPKDQGHCLHAGMESQLAQEALHVAAD